MLKFTLFLIVIFFFVCCSKKETPIIENDICLSLEPVNLTNKERNNIVETITFYKVDKIDKNDLVISAMCD